MNWAGLAVFLVFFGLLVIVPIVAILSDRGRKGGGKTDRRLEARLAKLEADLAAQKGQMDELKELVHVNIIKMEDVNELHQRLGPPAE